ncbi:MAG: sodium:solute symporter family protein [Candidatus Aminicenantes bacterium]|nr:sodium:solute symporter family protein [Candidatus Aminicenantes bacterium]
MIVLTVFLVGLFLSGWLFSSRNRNLEDFFLASRSLSGFLVFLTVSASWLGATSTLVSVDEAFQRGISAFWVMGMPTVVTVLVFAFVLAGPIRRLPIVSLPDLVETFYGRGVRHLSAGLIIWYMVLLAASQMVALGRLLESVMGMSYVTGLVLATTVVLAYSIIGGFYSVVITDGIQLVVLSAGIILLFGLLAHTVSFREVTALAVGMGKGDFFDLFADWQRNGLIFLSFTAAWIISPITWQRIQGARDKRSAVRGLAGSGVVLLVVYILITGIGMMSLAVLSPSGAGEPILSRLITTRFGGGLSFLLFVAVVSAILSTLDSVLNTGALSLTRDVFIQLFPRGDDRRSVGLSRLSTLIMGAAAFLVATRFQSILKTLGLASEIMAVGFFIPGMAMFLLKGRSPRAGLFSLGGGSLYALLGFFQALGWVRVGLPAWPYSVPLGMAGCAGLFLFGYMMDRMSLNPKEEKQ